MLIEAPVSKHWSRLNMNIHMGIQGHFYTVFVISLKVICSLKKCLVSNWTLLNIVEMADYNFEQILPRYISKLPIFKSKTKSPLCMNKLIWKPIIRKIRKTLIKQWQLTYRNLCGCKENQPSFLAHMNFYVNDIIGLKLTSLYKSKRNSSLAMNRSIGTPISKKRLRKSGLFLTKALNKNSFIWFSCNIKWIMWSFWRYSRRVKPYKRNWV